MAFQSPFLGSNPNNGIATNELNIIPPHGACADIPIRGCPSLFSQYAACVSPVKSARRMVYFPLSHASPISTTASIIDDLVRMEEAAAVASRMATHVALARLGAATAARQQQQRRHQEVTNYLTMQQQARVCTPIIEKRPSCNPPMKLPGLDLLGTAATIQQTSPVSQALSSAHSISSFSSLQIPSLCDAASTGSIENMDSNADEHATRNNISNANKNSKGRFYIDNIRVNDVLCGRGGRSNHHTGNKRYRQVVGNTKFMYQQCPAKTLKTDLSRAIVEHCCAYGARFIKKDEAVGRFYVLTKAEARKKTSQALRETKSLKWNA